MNRFQSSAEARHQPGKKDRFAVVIPAYNHAPAVEKVIAEAMELDLPVFVVDDGSTDDTRERIYRFSEIRILTHEKNMGKGAALMSGFMEASQIADWAITMDADGQHNPSDAKILIRAARQYRKALIVGRRTGMDGSHVHWTSRFGRKFSNFWVRASGGPKISDTQSGFRIYPLPEALAWKTKSRRFEFEVEILVRAHWQHVAVVEVPVGVSYLPAGQRVSHFRPWRDFFRNAKTFTGLILRRFFTRPVKTSPESKA
ncbi:MAG: glycosyltransferase family 2 protein [Desulfosalsimonas sp.]|uniref:glycosyltransferase family 2 protein n=1 Tax=Desulfosalsimonas sp. TaxID=3073848 RepID=UPI003970CF1D